MRIGVSAGPNSFQAMQVQAYNAAQQAMEGVVAASAQISQGNIEPSNIIGMKEQSTLYTMNLKLFEVADEMTGQVLNLRA